MKKACVLLLLICACSHIQFDSTEILIRDQKFKIEIAKTREQKTQGLKYRGSLGSREGMLFVYDRDQLMSFWMQDTQIPLSIAFLTKDGVIVQIEDMYPFDKKSVRSKYSVRYALEVNQGVFDELGLVIGDRIEIPREI